MKIMKNIVLTLIVMMCVLIILEKPRSNDVRPACQRRRRTSGIVPYEPPQIERKHYGCWNLVCYQCVLGVVDQSVGYHILNRKNSENRKNGAENSNSYRGINRNWCSNGGSPCTTI